MATVNFNAAGFHEDDDDASSIENDWDGSRGVDCDRRNINFDGGGTDEDGGASLCDGAGPSDEDAGASELDDEGGGGCDEDGSASKLDDEGGGGASDEDGGGGFWESSIVKEKTLNQRKTSNERNMCTSFILFGTLLHSNLISSFSVVGTMPFLHEDMVKAAGVAYPTYAYTKLGLNRPLAKPWSLIRW
ncbi:hypothetical protein TSUD_413250 [Trifolium subterraneum]|uniref:Uncharacterized protein n=1 Tax=Trifolium subterraneum TaxID=3900 RepID=A0A2Z6P4S2_TRISU|nr:hypothetical protein TSUD_413250 [Trifolium subterraneum]